MNARIEEGSGLLCVLLLRQKSPSHPTLGPTQHPQLSPWVLLHFGNIHRALPAWSMLWHECPMKYGFSLIPQLGHVERREGEKDLDTKKNF